MQIETTVNITDAQILQEMEYWSEEALSKFIFKMVPKIYRTNNLDPKYSLPFLSQLLNKTIKSMKYEKSYSPEVKDMIKELKAMAQKISEMEEKYYLI